MTTLSPARLFIYDPLRGKQAAREQWRFHCAIHNLLKLHRAGGLDLIRQHDSAPASPSTDSRSRLAVLAAVTHSLAAHFRRPLATLSADRFAQIAAFAVTDPRS